MAVTQIPPVVSTIGTKTKMTMPELLEFATSEGIVIERKTKTRVYSLSKTDKKGNVSKFAAYRLNNAADSLRVFGNCYGGNFDWTTEQIDKAESALNTAVKMAIENLRHGKRAMALGIQL